VAAVAIMLLVIATQLRNQLYSNVTNFWMDVLKQDDGNHRANWAMAGVFDANGETDVAMILAEKAVARRPAAAVFRSLADFHVQSGNYATALRMLRRGVEVQQAALGPDHEAVLGISGDLAATLRLAGEREEAEKLCEEILEPMRRVLGQDDPATLGVELMLAEQLSRSGDHAAAVDQSREILRRARTAQGPAAPATINAVTVLATCLTTAGRSAEAEQLVRSTQSDLSRRPRTRPADLLTLGGMLATILEETGRLDEAVALRRQLATDAARRYGEQRGEARSTATKLGMAMAAQAMKQGNPAEAARLYRLILDAYSTSLGPDHPETVAVREKLKAATVMQPPKQ
jgi:tetratricopeptide (TPR) repeat protein